MAPRAYTEPGTGRYTVAGDTYLKRGILRSAEAGGQWDPVSQVWRNVTEEGVTLAGAQKIYLAEVDAWCHVPSMTMDVDEADVAHGVVNRWCPICTGYVTARIVRVLGPSIYGGGYDGG